MSGTSAPALPGTRQLLAIILVSAVLFRCALVVTMPYLAVDSLYYDEVATNLALGNGFSTSAAPPYVRDASRPPLYPLFVSALYRLFGVHNYTAVRLAQVVLDSFSCLLVFLIARIPFSTRTALTASALASVNPFTAIYTATLMREVLLTVLTLLTVWAAMKVAQNRSLGNCALLGTSVGLGVLCKTIMLLFPLLLFGWLLYAAPAKRRTLLLAAATMAIVLVITVPWSLRERPHADAEGNALVLSETGGIGADFYWGTLEYEYRIEELVHHKDDIARRERAKNPAIDSSSGNLHYFAMGWERVKRHPVKYLANRVVHLARIWVTSYGVFNSRALTLMASIACILALAAGAVGIWLARPRWRESMPILLMLLYFELVYLPFHAEARYTIPVRPCLLIFVAVTLLQLWRACRCALAPLRIAVPPR